MKFKAWHFGFAATLAGYAALAPADLRIQRKSADPGAAVIRSVPGDGRLASAQDNLVSGKYDLALAEFEAALKDAQARGDAGREARVLAAYGYALYLRDRGKAAESKEIERHLQPAFEHLQKALKAAARSRDNDLEGWIRITLGLVYAESGRTEQAADEFQRSLDLANGRDIALKYEASLQMTRLEASPALRVERLRELTNEALASGLDDLVKLNLLLNIDDQLDQIPEEKLSARDHKGIRQLGYANAEKATQLAARTGQTRAQSQAEGYWADLHARDGDAGEAIRLLEKAISHGNAAGAPDLTLTWEARLGQLLVIQAQDQRAIEAYRRAAFDVNKVRNNIPIYQNGKSSYHQTLEPIYRGLADVLVRSAHGIDDTESQQRLLVEAVQSLELLKQSELEDYFNQRCIFDSTKTSVDASVSAVAGRFLQSAVGQDRSSAVAVATNLVNASGKTAILYPMIFEDRLELLLIHNGSVLGKTVPVTARQVAEQAKSLAAILGKDRQKYEEYVRPSTQLYQWLVEPLERDLRTKGIERLVYVPDGILRLVPLSVLSPDGQDFVTKHYVVVTNSGVRDVPQQVPGKPGKALLAGLSNPDGGVLSDPGIPRSYLAALRDKLVKRGTILPSGAEGQVPDIDALRGDAVFLAAAEKELVLQEVGQELSSIRRTIASDDPLLNQSFDKASFTERFKSGDYRIAHISTHGYFGHSADDSFIMAHDKILKIGELEEIMRSGASQRKSPVELVTFSACETAKGDDRAPLGFSGLAIKAKARNAMGALWPVDDEAARRFMEAYYAALGKNGGDNPKALQQAQLTLLKSEPMKHPSYWAPFILVGAW